MKKKRSTGYVALDYQINPTDLWIKAYRPLVSKNNVNPFSQRSTAGDW